jgi:hypothetical protein
MAETVDDFSTGEEWWLLHDVRAFVIRYCKTVTAAQDLLLEFARKGHFRRYRWHAPAGERGGIGIDPRLWGGPPVVVDWDNSCARYERKVPSADFEQAALLALRDFLPADSQQRMLLVRLHRDDVLAMLRAVGLLVEPATPPLPSQARSVPARPTRLEEMRRRGQLSRRQQREIAECVLEEFQPGGDSLPEELTASELADKVDARRRRLAQTPTRTAKDADALRRSCSRFLQNYRDKEPQTSANVRKRP